MYPARFAIAAGFALLAGTDALAQTNERTYESFQSRVITPGARAIAMGKAFIGVADDATAAASNPAGLSNLARPEVSIEGTSATFKTPRMTDASAVPVPTISAPDSANYRSFTSAVVPLTFAPGFRRVTVGFFQNVRQRQRETFLIPNFDINGKKNDLGGYWGSINIAERELGASAALIVTKRLSIGAAFRWDSLASTVLSHSSTTQEPNKVEYRSGSDAIGNAHKHSLNVGALYRVSSRWTLGASYHPGVTFPTKTTIHGVFTPDFSTTALPVEQIKGRNPVDYDTDFRIPTRFTVGLSSHPKRNLLFIVDAAYVRYSERITDKFLIVDFLAQPSHGLSRESYYVPNVVELHTGGEWRIRPHRQPVAIRAGLFTEPDHQMRFDISKTNGTQVAKDQARQFNTFRPGTKFGGTVGAGAVFRNRFQFDVALSKSFYEHQLVASTVYRF